jgi:hypothetical protein
MGSLPRSRIIASVDEANLAPTIPIGTRTVHAGQLGAGSNDSGELG